MPVYKTPPKWLRRAIEFLQEQYYADWELCAVGRLLADGRAASRAGGMRGGGSARALPGHAGQWRHLGRVERGACDGAGRVCRAARPRRRAHARCPAARGAGDQRRAGGRLPLLRRMQDRRHAGARAVPLHPQAGLVARDHVQRHGHRPPDGLRPRPGRGGGRLPQRLRLLAGLRPRAARLGAGAAHRPYRTHPVSVARDPRLGGRAGRRSTRARPMSPPCRTRWIAAAFPARRSRSTTRTACASRCRARRRAYRS